MKFEIKNVTIGCVEKVKIASSSLNKGLLAMTEVRFFVIARESFGRPRQSQSLELDFFTSP
jgi:hypothetical protein